MSTELEIAKLALMGKQKENTTVVSKSTVLHTGSTLLNLACTDTPEGGFIKGKYFFFVGDSSSGKTWLSLTCLAEAARNPEFKKYRFIYDNGEDGALMDMEKYFGSKMVKRVEPPSEDEDGEPLYSETVEDFYYNVADAVAYAQKEDVPFIYILDSENSLTSEFEQEKFLKQKKAAEAGKDAAGSFGDGKAKKHSENLRRLMGPLRDTKSILIIISQTRDNINPMSFETKTRSGGRALKFYACLEMWCSVKKKLKKTVKGKLRQIGVQVLVKIKKNRITGKERVVEIPIYHSFGIDDIGSCIDYMVEEGNWGKSGASVNAPDFEYKGKRDGLIRKIEEEGLELDLQELVGETWLEIENKCSVERKKRYE